MEQKNWKLWILATLMAVMACMTTGIAAADEHPVNPYQEEVWKIDRSTQSIGKRGQNGYFTETSWIVFEEIQAPSLDQHGIWQITMNKPAELGEITKRSFVLQSMDPNGQYTTEYKFPSTTTDRIESCDFVAPGTYRLVANYDFENQESAYGDVGYQNHLMITIERDANHSAQAYPTVTEKAEQVAQQCTVTGNPWQTALNLHDWLTHHAYYDYSYSFYGAEDVLIRGFGVCDSYSKAYLMLCQKAGITVSRVVGYAGEPHAWNAIQLDGLWYLVDVTWDDPGESTLAESGEECYEYFCLNDDLMDLDHTNDKTAFAAGQCNSLAANYYVRTGETAWDQLGNKYFNNGICSYSADILEQLNAGESSFQINCGDCFYTEILKEGNQYSTRYIDAGSTTAKRKWTLLAASMSQSPFTLTDGNQVYVTVTYDRNDHFFDCQVQDEEPDAEISWEVAQQGNNWNLLLSGEGNMPNYASAADVPWNEEVTGKTIDRVVVSSGITRIGSYAFAGLNDNVRIDFLQNTKPAVSADAFGEVSAVCRYYTQDGTWTSGTDGSVTWMYLPYYDEDNGVQDLYRVSEGWEIRPRTSEGYINVSVVGDQALEYTRFARNIQFEATPAEPLAGDDLQIINGWNGISMLSFDEGCGEMEIILPAASILSSVSVTGSGADITIHDPRENGAAGRTIVNNGTLVYDGSLGELYLSGTYNYDGSLTVAHVTVNGDIGKLNYYSKESSSQPYHGDLTVTGNISAGTIYGNKSLNIPGVTVEDNYSFGGMAIYTFTDIQQEDPIVSNSDLNLTEENQAKLISTGTMTIGQYAKRYYFGEDGKISLDLRCKDPSMNYPVWIDDVYTYNDHFSTDDIIYGEDTEIFICANQDTQIVFNGSAENGTKTGLAHISVEPDLEGNTTAEVVVNCPVSWLEISHFRWSKGSAEVQITDHVDFCEIKVDQGPGTSISLGTGGSIGAGQWERTLQGIRYFDNVSGSCELFSNGKLNILSAKNNETLQAILPSDITVTESAGQEAMLDLSQKTSDDLSGEEEQALQTFLTNHPQKEAGAVFDVSVRSVTVSEDGKSVTAGEPITKLDNPVQITVSNDTGAAASVVRLHEDETGTVVAEQLGNETEDDVLNFSSSLFSKYIIVRDMSGEPVPPEGTWDYEYEADEKTLIISGSGEIAGYHTAVGAPWHTDYPDAEIKRIVVGSGITGIGANVFAGFENKVRIDFTQTSMPSIDENAFGETVAVCRYYNDDASWADAVNTESVTWLRMPVLFQYGAGTYGAVSYQKDSEHPGWSVYVQMNDVQVNLTAAQAAEVLNDSGDLMLFAIPTEAADQAVYSNVENDYWCLFLFDGCEETFTLSEANCSNLPNTIDMIASGLSLAVTDTREEGLRRLRMLNGQVEYNGRIQTLLLENSNAAGSSTQSNSVRVNGTVERLDYYGAQTEQPYRGTVTVKGAVPEGTEYGSGTLIIEGLDQSVETTGAPVSTFSLPEGEEAVLIIDTDKTPAVQVATTAASMSADMYNLRYVFQENGNIWLTLNPGEETNISGGMIEIDVKDNTPDFSIDDIIWGERTTLYLSLAQGSDPVALNGKEDAGTGTKKGLKQLEISGWTHAAVNCPVGHLAIQPDPVTHGDIDLTINSTVRSAYLQFNNCAGKITLGEGGSIQGNFRPPLRDVRGFGPVTGTAAGVTVVSDNALRVMSWKYSDGTHAILPSDNEVARAWGGSGKAMIDLTDESVWELTDEEVSTLAEATGKPAATLRNKIARVFDLSVTSYTEEDGYFIEGENITSLTTAVPITIDNDAGTDITVAGLHRNGSSLSANVLDGDAATITEDTIGFRTKEFSKYLVISNEDIPDYTYSYDYYFGTEEYGDGNIYGTDSVGYFFAPEIGPDEPGNSLPVWTLKHVSGPDCFTLEMPGLTDEGMRVLMPNGAAMTDGTAAVYYITCEYVGQTSSWKTTVHMRDGSGLPKKTKLSYAPFDMATGSLSGEWQALGSKLETEPGKTYKIKCEADGEMPEGMECSASFYDASLEVETGLIITSAWDDKENAYQLADNEALVTVPAAGEYVLGIWTGFGSSNLQSSRSVAVECWTADTPEFAEPDISVEICDDEYDSVQISFPWVNGANYHEISVFNMDGMPAYDWANVYWGSERSEAEKCLFQINIVQGGQNRLMAPGEYYAEITLKGTGYRTTTFRRDFIVAGTGYSFSGFVIPAGTKDIETEAFAGIPVKMVKIPAGCTNIRSKAFDGSGLKAIYIPGGNITIDDDALPEGTLIYTPENSPAAVWAEDKYQVIYQNTAP